MFVRRKYNKSGTQSVQIISKSHGKYSVIKTIGCSDDESELKQLEYQAHQYIEEQMNQQHLFESFEDSIVDKMFSLLKNSSIKTIGPELIFGKIYDSIGYNKINEEMFRHLVIPSSVLTKKI